MSAKLVKGTLERAKPYVAVILLQLGFAITPIVSKSSLNQGMSPHVLPVYRHAVAAAFFAPFAVVFERKVRPNMTISVFLKIMLLALLEPVIDQNLFYTGMECTTATFTAAMTNITPVFAFLMAWSLRLEKVDPRSIRSQAKIIGTLVTVGGAMLMTLVKGPVIGLPWTKATEDSSPIASGRAEEDPVKGGLMIVAGCSCWAAFIILQAITLKSYPAKLSLTVLICLMGSLQGTIVALAMDRLNPAAWSLKLDVKLGAVLYNGIVCSGVAYYIQGIVMPTKGPIFVTAFNPLSMVLVAILGSFTLHEVMYLGMAIGALLIVTGLYLVLWGKGKDVPPETFPVEQVKGQVSQKRDVVDQLDF
ncbi:hypothetical protein MLD38_024165 [Melastoma candidum]|uniref:Uncharacterized protein n=1 Tax=Melastoma candidum TaxID=119954 RepID=A0ACB9NT00_9MYRT|nr:hypothetical protein MLD38_024165 [Melastoma candidum]